MQWYSIAEAAAATSQRVHKGMCTSTVPLIQSELRHALCMCVRERRKVTLSHYDMIANVVNEPRRHAENLMLD